MAAVAVVAVAAAVTVVTAAARLPAPFPRRCRTATTTATNTAAATTAALGYAGNPEPTWVYSNIRPKDIQRCWGSAPRVTLCRGYA